jgi:hypothetical protein
MPDTNPPIITEFAMPDPNAAPLNLTQLFQLANLLVSSKIDPASTYSSYVIGAGQPSVDDQDKVWFKKDSQGRPISIMVFWKGRWRRVYNGMLGEIRGFHGVPGYGPYPKNFNENGMGNAEGEYDGWHLCNGKDGTPDYSDKFLLGAHMNKTDSHSDYDDDEWVSWIDKDKAQHTGGVTEFTLNDASTFQPGTDIGQLKVGKYVIDSGGEKLVDDNSYLLYGKPSVNNEDKNLQLKIQSDGNIEPEPVSVINPFIALGWIIFVGYQS